MKDSHLNYFVGPAGWAYDDWKGIVYPRAMPSSYHPLSFLAQFFDTVEINSTFYHPATPNTSTAWLRHVAANPRFVFTAKLWERFTHHREHPFTEAEVDRAKEGLRPLVEANKLGALLIQFPWSFKRTTENRTWLARVTEAFSTYPLVLEVRHASWNTPEVFASLKERHIAFCNIDQPLFKDSLAPSQTRTAPVGYVRLHGRNQQDWFREGTGRDERYNYLYTTTDLQSWARRIRAIGQQADTVYVITNNHYRGQAVVNALEIEQALGKTDFVIPQHLLDEYPRLKNLLTQAP